MSVKILVGLFCFMLILSSCEQKVNTPDDKILDITGNWELVSKKILLPDSTIEMKPGMNIPFIMRVFSNNGIFEEIINDNLVFSYSKNQWSITNTTLTLNYANNTIENWQIQRNENLMTLQRPTTYLNQSATEKITYQTSEKIQFKNHSDFIGTWELSLILRINGESDTVIVPNEIGLSETLTFSLNSKFNHKINEKGNLQNLNGNWFNTYYIIIFKYDNNEIRLYSFNLEPGSKVLALEYSYYHNQELIFERREYTKQ